MQSINNQNVDNVHYKISRDHPTSEAQGELKGELHESQGGTIRIESTLIRWFSDSQAGRPDCLSGGQRQLKRGHQARVHSVQMVLVMARQGGWTT
jgi:hypothetical protein